MITLLQRTRSEIVALRRRNELLEAQMHVVNVFAAATGLRPTSGGASIDVVWEIDKEIKRLQEPVKPIESGNKA